MRCYPAIGARVRYTNRRAPERTCDGTVHVLYPGFPQVGPNGLMYRVPDPNGKWYRQFAPSLAEIEPILVVLRPGAA